MLSGAAGAAGAVILVVPGRWEAGRREAVEARLESLDEKVKPNSIGPGLFRELGGSALDNVLRTVQQMQVQLSAMADTKASIMITVCSIVLTVGVTRFQDPILRWPLVGLTVCTLLALLFAILAVLPSLGYPRDGSGGVDILSPSFNLLFFGHFSHLSRQRFESLLDSMARDNAEIYRMIARDLYGQGIVLARKKYRMLRYSYVTFLVGVVITAIGSIETAVSLAR